MADKPMPLRSDMDEEIEHALACYLDEPRTGLEQRVMASVAAAPSVRRWWQSRAIFAAASLIVALGVVGLLMTSSRKTVPAPQTSTATLHETAAPLAPVHGDESHAITALSKSPARHTTQVAATYRAPHTRKAAPESEEPLPKLTVFPAPEPMTAQDRALVELATNDPQLALHAFHETKLVVIHPLKIKPLQIAPLSTMPPQQNSYLTAHSTENEE